MMKLEKFMNTIVVTISGKNCQLMLKLVDEDFQVSLGCRKWQVKVTTVLTMRKC